MANQPRHTATKAQPAPKQPGRKPNDHGSISVQAHMKIFDPVTKRVFVEGRA